MGTRQIVIDIPEKVLLAERTDEATFAREVASWRPLSCMS
mgnify:CR=1 FL=1